MKNKQFDSEFSEAKYAIKKILLFAIPLIILLAVIGMVFGWFSDASKLAHDEFSPRAMLRKYEYFKDASQQIIARENDVVIYEVKIKSLCSDRKTLDRISRENCALYERELAGLKMSFNSLVAEYNSQSNKFNWESFDKTDGDTLPKTFKKR